MSQRSAEEVYQVMLQIASEFPLLSCEQCARAMMQWLTANQIQGKISKLKTKRRGEAFISSDRFDPNQSITENGTHYGVEVLGQVFDNLSTVGLTRQDWLQDFHCPSESFTIEEIDFT
ncbi:papain fold toxin domain-containing protein [Leptolyngbya sp. NIES-2104]|uniref:papain fold toxin domain-containing protein n=1 Tax=Leptolyngbya sp. NIES-2104 TaxID=1552121 RepID=UPI00073EB23A|nr:papain fold toxin domain-containing protein [Leptolyngbya sp. NIES-2104]